MDEPEPRPYNSVPPDRPLFRRHRQPDDAVELVQRALEVDPGNLESRLMLGNYLQQAGRLDEALAGLRQNQCRRAGGSDPLFGIAGVYKRRAFPRGRRRRARKAYEVRGDEDAARPSRARRPKPGIRRPR